MDDLDFLETALGPATPVDLDSTILQDLQQTFKDCEEPPILDIDDVTATLDSITTEEPPVTSSTHSKNLTPPQTPPKEFSTSPAEARINDALSSLLRSTTQAPSKKDIFSALQSTLMKECSQDSTPDVLLQTVYDPIPHSVTLRDQRLQTRYNSLQKQYPTEINKLSSFHRHHASIIESDRYMMLHLHAKSSDHFKQMYNAYFDSMLHRMMERVENSLLQLEKTSQVTSPKPVKTSLKNRTLLTKKAVDMMEEWYLSNLDHPYPCHKVVQSLAVFGNIREEQVRKWFANKRTRQGRTNKIQKSTPAEWYVIVLWMSSDQSQLGESPFNTTNACD